MAPWGWASRSADGPLLVNGENPIPDDAGEVETVRLIGKVGVKNKDVRVAASIEKPLIEMFEAAAKAGHGSIFISSGYRTTEEQRTLYEQSADKSYVQTPGHSEHETGLAVDISLPGIAGEDFSDTKAGRWLAKNSWKYGFILRYPKDKSHITGISYEPWHFRYVGKKIARECHEDDLCLEEYLGKR
jgi:D-alanyl-D-alanine carboxypeptidase